MRAQRTSGRTFTTTSGVQVGDAARSRAVSFAGYLGAETPPKLAELLVLVGAKIQPPERAVVDINGLSLEGLQSAVVAEAAALAAEAYMQQARAVINSRVNTAVSREVSAAADLVAAKATKAFDKAAKGYTKAVGCLPGGWITAEGLLSKGADTQKYYYEAVEHKVVMERAQDLMMGLGSMPGRSPVGDLDSNIVVWSNPDATQYSQILTANSEAVKKGDSIGFHNALGSAYLIAVRLGVELRLVGAREAQEQEAVLLAEMREAAPSNPFQQTSTLGLGNRPVARI